MSGWGSYIYKMPNRLEKYGLCIFTFLMAWLFLWVVQWRIVTYVCGNDPMLYIRAARILLRPDFYGAEAVRHALIFVAPGYPVFLAAVIKLFGPLSPYWINTVVLTATLPVLWFVFLRLMGSKRAASFSLLAWLWIIFSGYPLHAPFLLYPFRESPRIFLIILSYALLLRGIHPWKIRIVSLFAASLALIMACAIREPSVLILPGLLLGMGGLSSSWALRGKAWVYFLIPWLVAGLVGLIVFSHFNVKGFSQFSVVQYLGNYEVALDRIGKMMNWFPQRAGGVLGLGLIAIGVVRAVWKSRVLLAWFFLPAVIFFTFCAYMQMHDRYFLTSLLFLVVFAGYALDGLCRMAERFFTHLSGGRNRWLKPGSIFLSGVIMILLIAGLVRTTRQVRVWGPAVTASEVKEWQSLVAKLEPSSNGRVRIAVEQRARYLEDMLLSYTDAELLDPKQMEHWPTDWAPAHYFKPLNGKALWSTQQWLMYLKVFADRIIEYRVDLLPVGDEDADILLIGAGRYTQFSIAPRQAGWHEQAIELVPDIDQTLWLDFEGSDPAMNKKIQIRDAETGEVWSRHQMVGNGLQAVFLAREKVPSANAVLAVYGEGPLPFRPLVAVVCGDEWVSFDLGRTRRISLNSVFLDRTSDDMEIFCPILRDTRDLPLKLPLLWAEIPVGWEIVLHGKFSMGSSVLLLINPASDEEWLCELDSKAGQIRFQGEAGADIWLRLLPGKTEAKPIAVDLTSIEFRARR